MRRVTLLDGTRASDSDLAPMRAILMEELTRGGAEVRAYTLRDIKMAHCIGCFGCWLETPGICIEGDAGRDIVRAMIDSETVILFTPVTFGGYSSDLKKIVDRWIPLVLPYFGIYHGDLHHQPRYSRYPRVVGIGIQRHRDDEQAALFRATVGRNAINFHAPSHAAEVVTSTEDPESLRSRFQALLGRTDQLPLGARLATLKPDVPAADGPSGAGRALLIVGSPKIKSLSTSGVLGGYLLDRLKGSGWQTESLTLKAALSSAKGQSAFLSSIDRADLLLLAFPLYIDGLPFLVTSALEAIRTHRHAKADARPLRLVAICNNGFPEAHQNTLALAMCRRFAHEAGITWVGGLAMGAGEAISSGEPLTGSRSGKPPVKHVIRALDITGAALAEGRQVSEEAMSMIAKTPIPFVPFALWRWFFAKVGTHHWRQRAAQNGVDKEALLRRPYQATAPTWVAQK